MKSQDNKLYKFLKLNDFEVFDLFDSIDRIDPKHYNVKYFEEIVEKKNKIEIFFLINTF
jgi:hypothetical protein